MKPKRIAFLSVCLLVAFASFAFAQDAPPPGPSANVDPTDIGVIGLIAAAITFLTQATKWGALANLIPPWLRPFIALGLGVVGGVIDQVIRGESWSKAILGGIVAAFTAIAGNQLGSGVTPSGQAKKDAAAAVGKAMEGPQAEVTAKVNAMKADLDRVAAMPDKTARLRALAESATRASNGAR